MLNEKQAQEEIQVKELLGALPKDENELSDTDLELVVGGVSLDAALNSFLQLVSNWNQPGS